MNSAFETLDRDVPRPLRSFEAAWKHFKKIGSVSSLNEAWGVFRKTWESLPTWALFVAIVGLLVVVANPEIVLFPLAAGGFLVATYFTVKYAVRAALREHEREHRR